MEWRYGNATDEQRRDLSGQGKGTGAAAKVAIRAEAETERREEMSVRKSCENCKYSNHEKCNSFYLCGENKEYWELADDAKADVLHGAAPEHDIPKYKTCKRYINGSCDNAKIFADKPGVKFDCSKCKSYIREYHKLPDNTPTEPEHSYWEPIDDGDLVACAACGFVLSAYDAAEEEYCPQCQSQMGELMHKEFEHDAVSHPSHYTSGGIECIDCIKAALGENFMGFLIGNVIKYTYRYKDKNGVEDLKKARWYLDRAIKELENDKVD